ncbi:uncharacterized protein LOC124432484 [Vespa crabro]|uniref:uncharacterized protein LOC124432484 n=1 Tax=Vespa crabro TaxID=7445 RepID=UPI001F03092B|nr:uncharacterized protein LOC124432484 [Vespa crabro]
MVSKEEDYFDNEYYTMNRRFFRLIGLCQKTSSKNLIHICFINFMLAFGIFEQIHVLIVSEKKLILIAKLLETTLPTLCFASCYCNLLFNDRVMKKILYRIKSDWDDLASKPELVILKKYAEISRLCTLTIAILFYLYILFLIFPSLLSVFRYVFGVINETELILPLRTDYFMKNQMCYYIGLTVEYVIILIAGTVGIANYSMFILVIQHACALLTIVQWRAIEGFVKNQQNFYYSNNNCELIEERAKIIHIIKFYNKAIEFIDLLKSFYEAIQLLEEFFGIIFILLFQIISLSLNMTDGITRFSYVLASFSQIYAYVYLAQKLINNNVNVFTVLICQIPFYSLSLKTQNLLLFLIMRSMRPCNLSVRGAIVVSNDLFATFINIDRNYLLYMDTIRRCSMPRPSYSRDEEDDEVKRVMYYQRRDAGVLVVFG